jgi:serine-type D-Ala-D-Ala carboxypeptidase (penicillin-binding protein 5/6)
VPPTPTTPATFRRRRVVVALLLVVVLAIAIYVPMTLLAPVKAVAASVQTPAIAPTAAAAPTWPSYGASAVGAVGYPAASAQAGRTDAVPMASISKVITALVVLQAKPLTAGDAGPTITMTAADAALYGHYLALNGDVVRVQAGYQFTELDLLKLMLVKSANNYAGSLANWAFGSTDGYAAAATTWLTAHQLTGIHVVEPTGIDPSNVGTASDLVKLGELALQDPVIAPIVATTQVSLPNVGGVQNTNTLLGTDGVDGIKTGTLDGWGANLLFASKQTIGATTVTIVGVVLGGVDHPTIDRDIQTLIGSVTSGFHELKLASKGQVFGSYGTAWGQHAEARAAKDLVVVVYGAVNPGPDVRTAAITTAAKGSDAGTVRFAIGATTATVPLVLSAAITDPGAGWRLTHPGFAF